MKLIKLLTVATFVLALLAGPAFAGDKTCCEKAKDAAKSAPTSAVWKPKRTAKPAKSAAARRTRKKEEKK
jgi:hypothetical protein